MRLYADIYNLVFDLSAYLSTGALFRLLSPDVFVWSI